MEFTQQTDIIKTPHAQTHSENTTSLLSPEKPHEKQESKLKKEIENLGIFYENRYLLPHKNCTVDYILSNWFGNYFLLDTDSLYATWLFPNITSYYPETKKPENDRRLKESIMGGHHKRISDERASLQRIFLKAGALERYFKSLIMVYDFFGLVMSDFSTGTVTYLNSSDDPCSFILQQNLYEDIQRAAVPTIHDLEMPGDLHAMSLLKQKMLHLNYIKNSRFYIVFNSLIDLGFRKHAKSLLDGILRVSFHPQSKKTAAESQSTSGGSSLILYNQSKKLFSKQITSRIISNFFFICKRVLKYAMKDTQYRNHPVYAFDLNPSDSDPQSDGLSIDREKLYSQLLLYYRKSKCAQKACGFFKGTRDSESLRLGVDECVSRMEKIHSAQKEIQASVEKERLDFQKKNDKECVKPAPDIMNMLKIKVSELHKIKNDNHTVSKLDFTIHNSLQERIINKFSFLTIFDKRWLDDMVINYYGGLVMKRSADYPNILPLVYVFSNYIILLMDDIKEFRNMIQSSSSTSNNDSIMTKIFDYKYLFIPFNDWNHWGLICIDLENMMIEIYDSMSGNKQAFEKHMASKAEKFLQLLYYVTKGEKINVYKKFTAVLKGTKGPQQQNSSDCGVFVCKTMERKSIDAPLQFGMEYMDAMKNTYMPDSSDSQAQLKMEVEKAKQLSAACIDNTRLNIAHEILTNQLINVPTQN